MTATYAFNSQYFNSDGTPKNGAIKSDPGGAGAIPIPFEVVIATTSIDEVGDVVGICPYKVGLTPFMIDLDATTDMDSGAAALDADLVSRVTDKAGVHTDTTIIDTSALNAQHFGTARAALVYHLTAAQQVPAADDADGFAVLALKVITAAATAVAGTLRGVLWVR